MSPKMIVGLELYDNSDYEEWNNENEWNDNEL